MTTITAINQQRVLNAMGTLAVDTRYNCWRAYIIAEQASMPTSHVTQALHGLVARNLVTVSPATGSHGLSQAGRIEVTRMSDCPETCGAIRAGLHERWCIISMATTYAKFLAQYTSHKCTAACDHLADARRHLALVCDCGTPCHSQAELSAHLISHGGRA